MTTSCLSPTSSISYSQFPYFLVEPCTPLYSDIFVLQSTVLPVLPISHCPPYLKLALSPALARSHSLSLSPSLIHPPYQVATLVSEHSKELTQYFNITVPMNALSFLIFIKQDDSPSSSIDLSSSEYSSSPTYNNINVHRKFCA